MRESVTHLISTMDINEIIDLANSLRQERLFITTEQQTLQSLNEQVVQNSLEVYQAAWISAQQRVNLNRLTVARPNSTPALCCQRASLLETITFVDAFKVLKYQDVLSYGAFLQCLRRAPQLVASCLVLGDRLVSDSMPHIALSLAAGLYGTCLAPEDTNLMLQLLNYLMEMQIVRSETPQRMLRQGSCAFSSLYSVFHEGLFSAKLFLSAALKGPVMQLLMEEEMFLDIDPDKTVIRYPPEERVKKFGKEGTAEFQTKTQQHRKWTVNSLVTITNRFIVSLRDHWLLFPNSVAWLVRQMAALMVKENFLEKELNAMCTDLIFTHFICPAIVNPEPYGVTDAPISHIARFNLMQVAQILQMLALIQYQDVEIKLKDLYSKFDKDSVSTLLDSLLVASESDDIMAVSNTRTPTFIRTATFFTLAELQGFVSFFRLIADDPNPIKSNDVASNCIEQGFKSQLAGLLGPLPSPTDGVRGLLRGQGDSNSSSEALSSSPDIPKRGLLGKVSKPRISRISSGSLDNPTEDTTTPATVGTNGNNNLLCSPEAEKFTHNVLIIPFPDVQSELIGLLPEHEVLSHDLPAMPAQSNMTAPILTNTILPEVDISRPVPPDQMTEVSSVLTGSTGIEKRTRFSLSHDEGSIGNTSDNLEAVSEAASNHSVASSLELENEDQNDNLSDMVSANVSGRGTPNISGRDTPSSQVTEGGASEPRPPLATPTSKSLKQTRSDIQDKFCKFEIKKLLEGDETISIISDTWSTDVLASDSEIIEAYERSFGMGGHLTSRPPVFAPSQVLTEENNRIMIGPQIPDRVLDVSETQSESAWSTDVLASDSERMTEVDTDDCQSVARSDTDTARSEVDVEARVEPPLPDLPPLGPLQRFPSPISPLPNLSPLFLPQPLSRMERTASTLAKSSRDVPRPDDHGEVRNFEMFHGNFLQNGSLNSPTLVSARNTNPLQRESINEGRFTGRSLSLFEPNTCRLNLLDGSTNRLGSFFNQPRCEVPNPDSLINNSVFHSTSSPFVSSLVNGPFRLFGTQTQNHFDNVTSTDPLCTPHSLSENVQNAHAHVCLNNPSSDVSDSSVAANKINSGVAFRPIHDEKSMFNVTGKGGRLSDYRRRTLEYVNSNSNINLPHSPGSNGDVLENPLEEYNEMVHIESDIPIKEFTNGDNICNGISDLVSQMRSASISDISAHSSTNSTTIQRQSISLSILDDKIIQNKEITINNLILPVVNHIVGADARLATVDLSVPVEHNNLTAKPSSSTGAIPKSISFDSTAEKAHRDYDDSKMKRGTGNFFNKLKLGFKNRRGKGRGNGDDVRFEDSPIHNIESIKNKRHGYDERVALQSHETTEDILAKYRRKVSISSDVATSGGSDSTASQSSSIKSKSIQSDEQNDSRLKIDRTNRESGYTYEDAKRKLRLVLSTADLQCTDFKHSNATLETPLVSFLRIQLSEAIALQDGALIAQLHEALRSVRAIGAPGSRNLCRELLLEFKGRGQYILYLVQARQALLRTLSYLDRLLTRILCDRSVCNSHLIWECVRLFLERRECQLNSFCDEFRALSVADEKTYLLHTFVNEILREINRDQNWQAASDHQLLTASLAVERVVMGRVYLQALYPNGDGDISRDQVLYEHIRKLSRIVTVTHKDLRIPLRYHQESPWPYAQSAIQSMAAYRAPRDKVQCVVRCVTTIMHLLSMSGRDGRTVPAADDLIPVLVYVLIKANPPALLSTIQYVDSFYGNCLTGEAQYWWIQFCSAVEFIKTMDYRD